MKKLFSIFLILSIAISVLSGCGNKTSNTENQVNNPNYRLIKAVGSFVLGDDEVEELLLVEGDLHGRWHKIPSSMSMQEYLYTYDINDNLAKVEYNILDADEKYIIEYAYNADMQKESEKCVKYATNSENTTDIFYCTYNANGDVLENRSTNAATGKVTRYLHNYAYDNNGLPITRTTDFKDGTGSYNFTLEWTYDKNGEVLSQRMVNGTNPNYAGDWIYTRNENGALLKSVNADVAISEYELDRNDNNIKVTRSYNIGGVITKDNEDIIERDSNGDVIKRIRNDYENDVASKDYEITYKREEGLLLEETKTKADGSVSYTIKYTYRSNGVIETKSEVNSEKTVLKEYDENGNMIKYTVQRKNREPEIMTFEYEKV